MRVLVLLVLLVLLVVAVVTGVKQSQLLVLRLRLKFDNTKCGTSSPTCLLFFQVGLVDDLSRKDIRHTAARRDQFPLPPDAQRWSEAW